MGDIVRRGSAWYVRYRDADGVRRMKASHQPNKEAARRYLLEIEGRVARGLIGIPETKLDAPSVAELVERFLTEYSRPKIKDLTIYRSHAQTALRRALPLLGNLRADVVRPQHVDRLRTTLIKDYAPASVRVSLSFLSAMYSWAVKLGLVPKNPVLGIERPTAAHSLEYLSRSEVAALLTLAKKRTTDSAADRCLHAAVHLALHLGLRRGELLGLRFQDVDVSSRRLTVARSFKALPKSGKARHLRIPTETLTVVSEWLAEVPRQLGLVFPAITSQGPRQGAAHDLLGLPELMLAAGLRQFDHPWHVLRHTFASHYIMSGGNLLALQKILGHANIAETMRYAHLGDDYMAGEVDRLKF